MNLSKYRKIAAAANSNIGNETIGILITNLCDALEECRDQRNSILAWVHECDGPTPKQIDTAFLRDMSENDRELEKILFREKESRFGAILNEIGMQE